MAMLQNADRVRGRRRRDKDRGGRRRGRRSRAMAPHWDTIVSGLDPPLKIQSRSHVRRLPRALSLFCQTGQSSLYMWNDTAHLQLVHRLICSEFACYVNQLADGWSFAESTEFMRTVHLPYCYYQRQTIHRYHFSIRSCMPILNGYMQSFTRYQKSGRRRRPRNSDFEMGMLWHHSQLSNRTDISGGR
jgi:hypothetical protein